MRPRYCSSADARMRMQNAHLFSNTEDWDECGFEYRNTQHVAYQNKKGFSKILNKHKHELTTKAMATTSPT